MLNKKTEGIKNPSNKELSSRADHIIDFHKVATVEARTCAKQLSTLLLAQHFDQSAFTKAITRLNHLGYNLANLQSCMLSRYTMRVALGMDAKSDDNAMWEAGLERLGTSAFAVTQSAQEALNLRARYDGDEKGLQKAVFETFFPKGDIPK